MYTACQYWIDWTDFSHCYEKLEKNCEKLKLRLVVAIHNEGVLVPEYLREDMSTLRGPICLFNITLGHIDIVRQLMRLRLTQAIGYIGINEDIHMV